MAQKASARTAAIRKLKSDNDPKLLSLLKVLWVGTKQDQVTAADLYLRRLSIS